jgi:cell shape-determining protein MreD
VVSTGVKVWKLWKEERIFFYPLLFLICGLFVILRPSINHLLGIEWLDIDIIIILIIYLVAKDQTYKASCLAFFMGILTDIFAPCQLGLFAFVYSVLYLGVNYSRLFLDLNTTKTQILLVALSLLAKWFFLLITIKASRAGQFIDLITFILMFVSIFITSLITPVLFYFLNQLRGEEGQKYFPKTTFNLFIG